MEQLCVFVVFFFLFFMPPISVDNEEVVRFMVTQNLWSLDMILDYDIKSAFENLRLITVWSKKKG